MMNLMLGVIGIMLVIQIFRGVQIYRDFKANGPTPLPNMDE
jgi:hypothetical protein